MLSLLLSRSPSPSLPLSPPPHSPHPPQNSDSQSQQLTAKFSDVPGVSCTNCRVMDVWTGKDQGMHSGSFQAEVASHDVAFLLISEK